MSVDLTGAIGNFFTIFNVVSDWLKETEFTIGSVTFTLWGLMWSVILFSIFISFLYKVIGDN